jgi:hypothetical protein
MRSMRSDRIWDDGGEGELIGCHFDFWNDVRLEILSYVLVNESFELLMIPCVLRVSMREWECGCCVIALIDCDWLKLLRGW